MNHSSYNTRATTCETRTTLETQSNGTSMNCYNYVHGRTGCPAICTPVAINNKAENYFKMFPKKQFSKHVTAIPLKTIEEFKLDPVDLSDKL